MEYTCDCVAPATGCGVRRGVVGARKHISSATIAITVTMVTAPVYARIAGSAKQPVFLTTPNAHANWILAGGYLLDYTGARSTPELAGDRMCRITICRSLARAAEKVMTVILSAKIDRTELDTRYMYVGLYRRVIFQRQPLRPYFFAIRATYVQE